MNFKTQPVRTVDNRAQPDWWRGAVIYQVYPRSYQDSNGDGIGDLKGIAQRLPHIASLGVDAIWISPFFKSPMKDFGYDVSDYCDVDLMFGTLADFDDLLDKAHKLGMRVMIDLVLSHTSDQHPWFQESCQDHKNAKSDWYVWAEPKPDGTPPNNWLSIFGGSAWHWDGRREQYYLHNFLTSQPDLNFHNEEVQNALLDVAKFWLKRGVDGFRLDTINFYFHDQKLRDNPPLPVKRRNATIAPRVNPYNHQDHQYDKNQPENLAFLRSLRSVMEPYGAAAVGEVGDAQYGLEILGQYTAGDDLMHMCYAFEFLANAKPTASDVETVMDRVDEVAADGWSCWAFSNHDTVRHPSRWNLSDEGLKMMTVLMMCWRGSACIYQGEELGLPEAEVAFEELQDPYGIEFWPKFKGRDGCRTPMPWETQSEFSGFGENKPWLPVSPKHMEMAVDRQEEDPDAILHHYRRAIRFRHENPALRSGTQSPMKADGGLLIFTREHEGETYFCAFNLGDDVATVAAQTGSWQSIGADLGSVQDDLTNPVTLNPWQFLIAMKPKG